MEILSSEPIKNHLLAALPHAESQRWLPLLEPVDLPLGEVLYESGAAPDWALNVLIAIAMKSSARSTACLCRSSPTICPPNISPLPPSRFMNDD